MEAVLDHGSWFFAATERSIAQRPLIQKKLNPSSMHLTASNYEQKHSGTQGQFNLMERQCHANVLAARTALPLVPAPIARLYVRIRKWFMVTKQIFFQIPHAGGTGQIASIQHRHGPKVSGPTVCFGVLKPIPQRSKGGLKYVNVTYSGLLGSREIRQLYQALPHVMTSAGLELRVTKLQHGPLVWCLNGVHAK